MISVEEIREIDFSTSMSGYKKAEVDDFLDALAEDYEKLIKINQQLNAKVGGATEGEQPAETPAPAPAAATPVNAEEVTNILTTAQRFADQLIAEAKEKAEKILTDASVKAKELEEKIASDKEHHEEIMAELKVKAEESISEKIKEANAKSENMLAAAKQSVSEEKKVFDTLRLEASNFKSQLLDSYKKQLELLNELPVEIPFKEKLEITENLTEDIYNEETKEVAVDEDATKVLDVPETLDEQLSLEDAD